VYFAIKLKLKLKKSQNNRKHEQARLQV